MKLAALHINFSPEGFVAAAANADFTAVELFLKAGIDVNVSTLDGTTALSCAVAKQDLGLTQLLLKHGASPNVKITAGSRAGIPLLMLAMDTTNHQILEALLKNGGNANARSDAGTTLLMAAIDKGDAQAAESLLDHGADPGGRVDLGKLKGVSPVLAASASGNRTILQKILEHGADPNVATESGETPLMFAVARGREEIARILITKAADLNVTNSHGETALDVARSTKHPELVAVLEQAGARVLTDKMAGELVAKLGGDLIKIMDTAVKTGDTNRVKDAVSKGLNDFKEQGFSSQQMARARSQVAREIEEHLKTLMFMEGLMKARTEQEAKEFQASYQYQFFKVLHEELVPELETGLRASDKRTVDAVLGNKVTSR